MIIKKEICKNKCPRCGSNKINVNLASYEKINITDNLKQLWISPAYCKDCRKPFTIVERHIITYINSEYEED